MTGACPRRRLIVFAKYPRAGEVKTRLVPPLTFDEAAELYGAFLGDMLSAVASLDANIEIEVLSASERDVEPIAEMIAGSMGGRTVLVGVQRGAGLGDRLASAFDAAVAAGAERVCIVGADHPTLPLEHIALAFDGLDESDVVIGPAEDGGYYLIGLSGVCPELFSLESFSTPRLLAETLAAAERLGRSTALLPPWYDVDDAGSLARLLRDRHLLPTGSRTAAMLDRMCAADEGAPVREAGADITNL